MKRLRILAVGHLKAPHWRQAAAFYHTRLSHTLKFEELCVKDASPGLPPERKKEEEAARLQKLLRAGDHPICLDENGASMDSRAFASFLGEIYDRGQTPCFILGGAYGLSPALLRSVARSLSLGRMTFTHEMARVILLEQIYRAENILAGTGYHH